MTQGSAPQFFHPGSLGGLGHCPQPWGHVPWLYRWCLALLGVQVAGRAAWGPGCMGGSDPWGPTTPPYPGLPQGDGAILGQSAGGGSILGQLEGAAQLPHWSGMACPGLACRLMSEARQPAESMRRVSVWGQVLLPPLQPSRPSRPPGGSQVGLPRPHIPSLGAAPKGKSRCFSHLVK